MLTYTQAISDFSHRGQNGMSYRGSTSAGNVGEAKGELSILYCSELFARSSDVKPCVSPALQRCWPMVCWLREPAGGGLPGKV